MTTDATKLTGGAAVAPKKQTHEEKSARAAAATKDAPKPSLLDRMTKPELRAYAGDHGIKLEGNNVQAWRASIVKSGKAPK